MREEMPPEESTWIRVLGLLVELLVPVVILVVGLLLSEPRSKWLTATLAVSIGVIASTVVALHLSRYYMRRTEHVIEEMAAAVSKRMEEAREAALIQTEGREGLTQEKLSEYENRLDVETIWIVGENFDSEIASEAPFLNVVRDNIYTREVKYVYIAPDLPALKHKFDRLRNELDLEDDDARLVTILLPLEKWQKVPYTGNLTIYDPVRKGTQPEGYCWDPGGDGKSFIKLRHKVVDWVGDIQEICPQLDPKHHDSTDHDGQSQVDLRDLTSS